MVILNDDGVTGGRL